MCHLGSDRRWEFKGLTKENGSFQNQSGGAGVGERPGTFSVPEQASFQSVGLFWLFWGTFCEKKHNCFI